MALDKFQPYLFVSAGEQSNKYLTPTITNGIAQFQAQRAQSLTGLTVQINPIQEGTGDPSPTNIRPISGRTGLTVTRAGKNLLALPASAITTNGVTVEATSDGELWVHGTPTIESGYMSFALPQLPEVVVDKTVSISINEKMPGIGVTVDAGDAKLNLTLADTTTYKTGVYKPGGGRNPRINVRYDVGTINKKFQIQLEIASAPSAFTPYVTPTTYPITWQTEAGTVYGGTLDVVSGVLTVTHAAVDMGTLTWAKVTHQQGYIYFLAQGGTDMQVASMRDVAHPILSSNYPTQSWSNTVDNASYDKTIAKGWSGQRYIAVRDSTYDDSDASAFKTAMNGVQLLYPLATPQTYQLTPTEVRTIAGYNQIYSDAGPVIDIKF